MIAIRAGLLSYGTSPHRWRLAAWRATISMQVANPTPWLSAATVVYNFETSRVICAALKRGLQCRKPSCGRRRWAGQQRRPSSQVASCGVCPIKASDQTNYEHEKFQTSIESSLQAALGCKATSKAAQESGRASGQQHGRMRCIEVVPCNVLQCLGAGGTLEHDERGQRVQGQET